MILAMILALWLALHAIDSDRKNDLFARIIGRRLDYEL
jgi:hypothetical protein